jgi:hypothetical protein
MPSGRRIMNSSFKYLFASLFDSIPVGGARRKLFQHQQRNSIVQHDKSSFAKWLSLPQLSWFHWTGACLSPWSTLDWSHASQCVFSNSARRHSRPLRSILTSQAARENKNSAVLYTKQNDRKSKIIKSSPPKSLLRYFSISLLSFIVLYWTLLMINIKIHNIPKHI